MNNQAVKTHFDKLAPFYDEYKRRNKIYYDALKNTVKSLIAKKENILDIGCGTGHILDFLQPNKGIGIDLSSEMMKIAKRKYQNNPCLTFAVHDIESKFLRGNFDYILLLDVIEHLKDKNRAIHNISKTMNNQTILIISMINPAWEPLLILLEKLQLKMPEGPHMRINEEELSAILFKYNLQIIEKIVCLPKLSIPAIKQLGLIYVYKIKKI